MNFLFETKRRRYSVEKLHAVHAGKFQDFFEIGYPTSQ